MISSASPAAESTAGVTGSVVMAEGCETTGSTWGKTVLSSCTVWMACCLGCSREYTLHADGTDTGTNSRSRTTAHKIRKVVLGRRSINSARRITIAAIITAAEMLIVRRSILVTSFHVV